MSFLPSSMLLEQGVAVSVAFGIVVVLQVVMAQGRVSLSHSSRRQLQHVMTGQVLIGISYILPIQTCILLLMMGCLAILVASRTSWYQETFGPLLRPHEKNGRLPGAFYFLCGTTMVAYLYEINIARYAVLCLSWADPCASLVGRMYPIRRIDANTSVGGSLACWSVATVLGILCFDSLPKALVGATVCTIAEALPICNDNIMIPVMTATAIHNYNRYNS